MSYGATDQQTFRSVSGSYEGLLVPGTIAAWQQQGTGGFVLTMSAMDMPYVIDPRFPLFQQRLVQSKQSHLALARLFGDESLIQSDADPEPTEFSAARLERLASAWADFNRDYDQVASEKFEKYAKRLDEPLPERENARGPEAVLSPYFACRDANDPWWPLSQELFRKTAERSSDDCFPVLCATAPDGLTSMISAAESESLVIWQSGLDEHHAQTPDLVSYRDAISDGRSRELFALYGGFYSVLMGSFGLRGSAHGVGFSEHRDWIELPESGAPPARYYVRRSHRYVTLDLAQLFWEEDRSLVECPCEYCAGRSPIELDYHELMKHSVACRAEEIKLWIDRPPDEAAKVLRDEHDAMSAAIDSMTLLPRMRERAYEHVSHLPRWADALTREV